MNKPFALLIPVILAIIWLSIFYASLYFIYNNGWLNPLNIQEEIRKAVEHGLDMRTNKPR